MPLSALRPLCPLFNLCNDVANVLDVYFHLGDVCAGFGGDDFRSNGVHFTL